MTEEIKGLKMSKKILETHISMCDERNRQVGYNICGATKAAALVKLEAVIAKLDV